MKISKHLLALAWITLTIFARLIPHPPNVNPLTAVGLFSGSKLPRSLSIAISLGALLLSDIALAAISGHAVFGYWSIFTYSGFLAIVLAGHWMGSNPSLKKTFATLLGSSFGFWIWTNFGIWITNDHGLYPRTMEGLMSCYTNAIPFLANSLAGDLVWGSVIFFGFAFISARVEKLGHLSANR
ncbi:MAG: hypothetical protein M9962_09055 [Oligoflexia bacterium]|nr:hypothetical protein [Oligoflexia bacterium]